MTLGTGLETMRKMMVAGWSALVQRQEMVASEEERLVRVSYARSRTEVIVLPEFLCPPDSQMSVRPRIQSALHEYRFIVANFQVSV